MLSLLNWFKGLCWIAHILLMLLIRLNGHGFEVFTGNSVTSAVLFKNCWDNAVMERFFRSLKTERLNHLSFINHNSVVNEVENYIQFYNYKRRHSGIEYMTPHQKYNELKKVA